MDQPGCNSAKLLMKPRVRNDATWFAIRGLQLIPSELRALLEVVGEVENGRDAIRLAGTLAPRLVLMDIST
jgi:hypothetical protein